MQYNCKLPNCFCLLSFKLLVTVNNDKQMDIRLFRIFFLAIFVALQLFTQLIEGQPGVVKDQPNVIDIQTKIPRNK